MLSAVRNSDRIKLTDALIAEALRRGVAMVQQHFALVEVLTALENVILGAETAGALGRLELGAARAKADGYRQKADAAYRRGTWSELERATSDWTVGLAATADW